MKKTVLALSLILCILLLVFLKDCKTLVVKSSPNIIYVPEDFSTIQDAINNANSGDIIFVRQGTYYENIIIDKSISLVGEEKESTIIDGSIKRDSVIFIKGVNNVIVKNFTLLNSGSTFLFNSGVYIESSSNSNISDNIIISNFNGISLSNSHDIVICNNNISKNYYYGIIFYWSFNNLIKNNIVSDNKYGIGLYLSQNNTLSANIILNNNRGIDTLRSYNNIIYHNNFDNIVQASSSESVNAWSYGDEGNYWSDYAGQDLNGDGIGDVPYGIGTTQIDDSPLMGMFSEFDFTYKGEAYWVVIISNSTISDVRFQIGNDTGNKILQFKVRGDVGTFGFCRVGIPTQLMNYPYVTLVGGEDVNPVFLGASNKAYVYLYFKYLHENQTVTIISSGLYSELFSNYQTLKGYLYNLNMSYYNLVDAYNNLNGTLNIILDNYAQLQNDYQALNSSYQAHLLKYSENVDKIQNLTYIFLATATILIIAIAYLSKCAHSGVIAKRFGESQ